jgi:hypothetical protein
MLYQNGTATDGYYNLYLGKPLAAGGSEPKAYPVKAGDVLEASAFVSTHRCQIRLIIQFYNASGTTISTAVVSPQSDFGSGSSTIPDEWTRIGGRATAPATAVSAAFIIQKFGTTSSTTSYLFVHKPMLCLSHAQATELTPWSSDGVTFVSGDEIVTGAITAEKIAANAVVAGKIAAGAVTAGTIAAGAVTAGTVAAGSITGDRIAAGTLTSALINTASFQSAGLAIFGGALASNNHVGGSVGWRATQAGDFEVNNLIVRNSLVVGSVSDIEQSYLPSEYRWLNTTLQARTSVVTGPIDPADLWFVHVSGQQRNISGADLNQDFVLARIRIQRRTQTDGVWTGYSDLVTLSSTGYDWNNAVFTDIFAGEYSDVQYRVANFVQSFGAGGTGNNYRRLNITARKITR